MKDRIRKLRKEKELTQTQFGEKIGVKGNTITNYETGLRTPTDTVINNICKTFNVNEHWLRDGTGEMFVELDVEDQLMEWAGKVLGGHDSKFKKRFITMLMRLSDREWELLEEKAKELVADADETEKGD